MSDRKYDQSSECRRDELLGSTWYFGSDADHHFGYYLCGTGREKGTYLLLKKDHYAEPDKESDELHPCESKPFGCYSSYLCFGCIDVPAYNVTGEYITLGYSDR